MSSLLHQNCIFSAHPMCDEEEHVLALFPQSSDLSIYEDESSFTVEASMPGIETNEAEVTFQKGILLIRGTKKQEYADSAEKKKTYHRRANRTYLYQLAIPSTIDERQEARAELKNGIMKVTFLKQKKEEPRRIFIQG